MEQLLFETRNLMIRKFVLQDTDDLYAVLSNANVMKFIESPFSRRQTRRFILRCGMTDTPLVYAIFRKNDSKVIGHVIFHKYDADDFEIGWVIGENDWGHGYAKEILETAIVYAKKRGIVGLVLECAPEQTVTRHIAEKYGFILMEERKLLTYRLPLS